jgi:hypothetical protein
MPNSRQTPRHAFHHGPSVANTYIVTCGSRVGLSLRPLLALAFQLLSLWQVVSVFQRNDHTTGLPNVDFFTTISAEQKIAAGMKPRLWRLIIHPFGKVLRMYLLKLGFLDGRAGFIVAVLGGYYVFLKYAKHWELSRRLAEGPAGDHD